MLGQLSWPELIMLTPNVNPSHKPFSTISIDSIIRDKKNLVVWYSHLFKNLPQFFVFHTVKGFSVDNDAEVDVFLELSCFLQDPANVGNLISSSSASSEVSLYFW